MTIIEATDTHRSNKNGWLNRNLRLLFIGSALSGISSGIFAVVFNLYILEIGISPEMLGGILSAGPFAQAIGSIPMAFLMERVGYKKVFVFIYGITTLGRFVQIATTNVPLMAAAAFGGGLAFAGDFVVRLPFMAANSAPEDRNKTYSTSSILYSVSMAAGALFAGYAPNFLRQFMGDHLAGGYQITLLLACVFALLGVLPFFFITEEKVKIGAKISLAPYFWGMDRFTIQQAAVSLFVGIGFGLINPFMNIYYVYHLGTTREFFGVVSALVIFPAMAATLIAPMLANKIGSVRIVTIARVIIPGFVLTLAFTTNRWLGTFGYWGTSILMTMSQPLSFAFAMLVATPRTKPAASAWLNVTFWLGVGLSAPLAGTFMAQGNYQAPLMIASAAILMAGLVNDWFFRPIELSMQAKEIGS